MRCPICDSADTKVKDSRVKGHVYRRRKCLECEETFSTFEESFLGMLDRLEEGGLPLRYVDKVANILYDQYEIRKRPEWRGNLNYYKPEEIAIVEKYYPIEPASKVAERLGRSEESVYVMASKLGVKKKQITPEEIKEAIQAYPTTKAMAAGLEMSKTNFLRLVKKYQLNEWMKEQKTKGRAG